ncbi:MAG: alpha/beta hydrolase [Deltaproteobacteria bacterium]|nr:alpha/beta hydrolase [Deltaproteobacteria bacterium]
MISIRWALSVLFAPFLGRRRTPLIRPDRIEWNPSLSPQTIQVQGHTIFYVVKGEGEPLLLIHGFGAGMWIWEKQIEVLSRSFRVYAIDLIGHGFSDRPKIDYDAETYIHFMKAFMDGVGIEKATLIGNSMGGGIAWATAISFPERVSRLILIDCMPPDILHQASNDSFKTLFALKRIPLLPYLIIGSRSERSIKWILQECISGIQQITPEIVSRQYQLSSIKGSTWVLYSTLYHAQEAMRFKDSVGLIRQPTLLIWGEDDLIFPPSVGEKLHQAIRGSVIHVVKESGHIPMWETPKEVNEAILSFLEK